MYFRVGGPKTVRGYDYGARWGREFWSAQLDVALTRRGGFAPVAFVDVGDTFASDPMVGAGAGISLLNGLVRFNLAKGLRPRGGFRFDLLFRAPR
jgi:hemolysin activation/secretion protein